MKNIIDEFNGTYKISKEHNEKGAPHYIGRLQRGSKETNDWSDSICRPFITTKENFMTEKYKLKKDIMDYTFGNMVSECEKFELDELTVDVQFKITSCNGFNTCIGSTVSVLSYKKQSGELASSGLYKIKLDMEQSLIAWGGKDGRLSIFLNDLYSYEQRNQIIEACNFKNLLYQHVEGMDFSDKSDREISNIADVTCGVSESDVAVAAYKGGKDSRDKKKQLNRVMDILFKMSKYPAYMV